MMQLKYENNSYFTHRPYIHPVVSSTSQSPFVYNKHKSSSYNNCRHDTWNKRMTLIRPLGRSSEVNALPLKSESDPTFCCTLSAADVNKCFELSADPRNEVIKFNYGISHLPHKPPSNMICVCSVSMLWCSVANVYIYISSFSAHQPSTVPYRAWRIKTRNIYYLIRIRFNDIANEPSAIT